MQSSVVFPFSEFDLPPIPCPCCTTPFVPERLTRHLNATHLEHHGPRYPAALADALQLNVCGCGKAFRRSHTFKSHLTKPCASAHLPPYVSNEPLPPATRAALQPLLPVQDDSSPSPSVSRSSSPVSCWLSQPIPGVPTPWLDGPFVSFSSHAQSPSLPHAQLPYSSGPINTSRTVQSPTLYGDELRVSPAPQPPSSLTPPHVSQTLLPVSPAPLSASQVPPSVSHASQCVLSLIHI